MSLDRNTYHIVAEKKRTGERIEGTVEWDGLSDLFPVKCKDGEVRYVSSLDTWHTFDKISAENRNLSQAW